MQRAVGDRIEPEVGLADRLLDGPDLALVPDLHGDGARIGRGDGRHLVDRHALPVDVDDDGVEQMHAGAPGAQPAELLLERVDGAAHAALEFLDVEFAGGHGPLPWSSILQPPPQLCAKGQSTASPRRLGRGSADPGLAR